MALPNYDKVYEAAAALVAAWKDMPSNADDKESQIIGNCASKVLLTGMKSLGKERNPETMGRFKDMARDSIYCLLSDLHNQRIDLSKEEYMEMYNHVFGGNSLDNMLAQLQAQTVALDAGDGPEVTSGSKG